MEWNSTTSEEVLHVAQLANTVQKLSLARNIKEVMKIVRTVARELTGADGATFVLRDGNLCYYADEDAISPLWKGNRFPMETCISGWVMFNKQAAVIEDIYADERIPHDAYRPTFVKSLVMVPIRTMEPLGAIGNYWAEQRQPSVEDVKMLQALADITAVSIENIEVHQKLKHKLKERNQMLKEITNQKSQLEKFTHIIAHNIRAPLSNLTLLADMVKSSKELDKKMMLIEKQQPIIKHLFEVFEELVDAIQVKSNFSIERDYLEFEEIMAEVLGLLQGDVLESDAQISWDFSEASSGYFPKQYLESALFNLVSNSLKYRHPDRVPEIKIRSFKAEGWTWLSVHDNGLGIDLDKHGDKLYQLRKTFHNHPRAKGFGLFITKAQIEAMDGSIGVESTPNVGTTFTIKLNENAPE